MNIKDIRTRKGLTQAEVASALGVSSVVYSRYETGSRQPSIDILIQLADIFGVTVDYLLGRQDIEDSKLPCGSASTSRTRLPELASPTPRLTVVVVLPTPPF